MNRQKILPPSDFGELFTFIADYPDAEFGELVSGLRSSPNYLIDRDFALDLAKRVGLSLSQLATIISRLQYLYGNISPAIFDTELPREDVVRQLLEEIKERHPEESEIVISEHLVKRLSRLLEPFPSNEKDEKIERLKAGFIDSAFEFATLVDLRPFFSEMEDGTPGKIEGYLPTTQLRFRTNSEDSARSEVIVNLTEEDLKELIKVLDRGSKKLEIAKEAIAQMGGVLG